MVYAKLETIYTRISPDGTIHRLEHRIEIAGTSHEVCSVLNTVMPFVQLPGTELVQDYKFLESPFLKKKKLWEIPWHNKEDE